MIRLLCRPQLAHVCAKERDRLAVRMSGPLPAGKGKSSPFFSHWNSNADGRGLEATGQRPMQIQHKFEVRKSKAAVCGLMVCRMQGKAKGGTDATTRQGRKRRVCRMRARRLLKGEREYDIDTRRERMRRPQNGQEPAASGIGQLESEGHPTAEVGCRLMGDDEQWSAY